MMKHHDTSDVTSIILEIFRLNGRLIAAGDDLVAPLGLTSARWQVIGAIVALGPAPVPRIADAMGLTRQSVQRIADELEKSDIVDFAVNPHHKRAKLIRLTPKGQALYAATVRLQTPWAAKLGQGIDPGHLKIVRDVLALMKTRLDPETSQGEMS